MSQPETTIAVAPDGRDHQPAAGPVAEARVKARIPLWQRWSLYGVVAKLVVGAILLVLWEVGVRWYAPTYVARPTRTIPLIPEVITSSEFLGALSGTLIPIGQGLGIAIAAALIVGLAMGQIPWVGWSLTAYTNALFALPMVAVVPLITIWAGYTETARLAIIIFAAYFPMVLNVYDGARSVSGRYLEVAATYHAKRPAVWFGIVVPASIPYLMAGFRLASGRALVGAVVAEYLIGIEGLGFYVLVNARSFRHDEAMVAVFVLGLLGILSLELARWATRRLAPWYRTDG